MRMDTLERRRDPRTQASVPIRLFIHESEELLPGHLADLSPSGAAIVFPHKSQPTIGQYIDLIFERPAGGIGFESIDAMLPQESAPNAAGRKSVAKNLPSRPRRQTAIVMNVRGQENDTCRVGVRFMECGDSKCELIDPIDSLSDYRSGFSVPDPLRKWETARHFNVSHGIKPPAGVNRRKPAALPV